MFGVAFLGNDFTESFDEVLHRHDGFETPCLPACFVVAGSRPYFTLVERGKPPAAQVGPRGGR